MADPVGPAGAGPRLAGRRPGLAARRRARGHRHAPADRDVRPVGRRRVSTALHADTGMRNDLHLRRVPGRGGHRRARLSLAARACWRRRSRRCGSVRAAGGAPPACSRRSAATATSRWTSRGPSRSWRSCSTAPGASRGRATPYVAVCGPVRRPQTSRPTVNPVGRALARAGAILVCGGLGGAMEAAARGAAAEGGTVLGILPGSDRLAANDFVTVSVPTGMGEMRNALVVRAADAVIAGAASSARSPRSRLRSSRGRRSSGSARGSSRSRGSGGTTTSSGPRRRTRR